MKGNLDPATQSPQFSSDTLRSDEEEWLEHSHPAGQGESSKQDLDL